MTARIIYVLCRCVAYLTLNVVRVEKERNEILKYITENRERFEK